jgi:hypothetical protein
LANSYAELDGTILSSQEVNRPNNLVRAVTSNTDNTTFNSLDLATCQQQVPDIAPIYNAMLQCTKAPDWCSFVCYSEDTMNLLVSMNFADHGK